MSDTFHLQKTRVSVLYGVLFSLQWTHRGNFANNLIPLYIIFSGLQLLFWCNFLHVKYGGIFGVCHNFSRFVTLPAHSQTDLFRFV